MPKQRNTKGGARRTPTKKKKRKPVKKQLNHASGKNLVKTVPLCSGASLSTSLKPALPQYGGVDSPFHHTGNGITRGNAETITLGGRPLQEAVLRRNHRIAL